MIYIKKILFIFLLATTLMVGLTSCNPVDKFANDQNINSVVGFSERQEKIIVLDPKEGKPLLTCEKRENNNLKNEDILPCKTRIRKNENGKPILVNRETGELVKFQHLTTIYNVTFPGSHCETYYVGGKQYEICEDKKED